MSYEVITPFYQSIETDTLKRKYLRDVVQTIKGEAVDEVSKYKIGDTEKDYQLKNRVRYYREIPAEIREIMEQKYDAKAGKGSFAEDQDFAYMLDEYNMPKTGYKDDLSRKNLMRIYQRGIKYK